MEDLCSICKQFDFDLLRPAYQPGDDAMEARVIHTRIYDQFSETCSFCVFVDKFFKRSSIVIEDHSGTGRQLKIVFYRIPVGGNISKDDQFWQVSIELEIRYKDYLCMKGKPNGFITVATDSQERIGNYSHHHGRVVDACWTNIEMIKMWLRVCETSHRTNCQPIFTNENLPAGFRVLDLDIGCLVDVLGEGIRYVTLSYVWGNSRQFALTEDTHQILRQPGALETYGKDLPTTIRDTIFFCQSIGERYLWVDSLCILQDNDLDKENQIGCMDSIFANSRLTIVAAEGDCSDAGLPGISSLRSTQISAWTNNMQLISSYDNIQKRVDDSVWNSRAWTFLESYVSNRKLFFTHHMIYFQCREMMLREDIHYMESALQHGPCQRKDTKTAYQPLRHPWHISSYKVHGNHTNQSLNTYRADLDEFLRRDITYQSDILNAFTAIINLYIPYLGPFLWGFPEQEIHSALCWACWKSGFPSRRSGFPSWSWTGWIQDECWWEFFEFDRSLTCIHAIFAVNQTPAVQLDATVSAQKTIRAIWAKNDAQALKQDETEILSALEKMKLSTQDSSQLLIFSAYHAKVRVSTVLVHYHQFFIFAADQASDSVPSDELMKKEFYREHPELLTKKKKGMYPEHPKVYLSPAWREKQPEFLDFIAVQYMPGLVEGIRLMLVEWVDGIAYRVFAQCVDVKPELWNGYNPQERLIFLG